MGVALSCYIHGNLLHSFKDQPTTLVSAYTVMPIRKRRREREALMLPVGRQRNGTDHFQFVSTLSQPGWGTCTESLHYFSFVNICFILRFSFVIFSSFMYLAASFKGKHYLEMSSNKVGCHQWHISILVLEIIWRGRDTTPPCTHLKITYTLQDYLPIKVVNTFISEALVGVIVLRSKWFSFEN